jgi:antirestriction protein ArdC
MAKIAELYEEVTNRIAAELEKGVKPWAQPWKGSIAQNGLPVLPCNLASGRPYSGINTLILWGTALSHGYPTHQWLTFQQAQQIGARVKSGEKSVSVIFTKWIEEEKDGKTFKQPIVRRFHVFNKVQLEGIGNEYDQLPVSPEIAKATLILDSSGIKVNRGYTKAYYDKVRDEVFLPAVNAFPSGEAYIKVAFHECCHATGHEKRLNRQFGKRFGDAEYGHEELVAELGAAFLCAKTNIAYTAENTAYIDTWLKQMKQDSRYIFKAASHASQAADWLEGRSKELLPNPEHLQEEELEAAL